MNRTLTTIDHDRNSSEMTYVYPVISRRSQGVSLGINLNPNNACNWSCIYCQVPNLKRGVGPRIDLKLLEVELRQMLEELMNGTFFQKFQVPEELRKFRDIAISGNGEATTSPQLLEVVSCIQGLANEFQLKNKIKFIFISNGSQMLKAEVHNALSIWASMGGEVWFKFDRATKEGIKLINRVGISPEFHRQNLAACTKLCPTWIQTCVFSVDDLPPPESEVVAYKSFLLGLQDENILIKGVLIYGMARPPLGPHKARLSAINELWIHQLTESLRKLGINAIAHP